MNIAARLAKLEQAVVESQLRHLPRTIIKYARLTENPSAPGGFDTGPIELSDDERLLADEGIAQVFVFEEVSDEP